MKYKVCNHKNFEINKTRNKIQKHNVLYRVALLYVYLNRKSYPNKFSMYVFCVPVCELYIAYIQNIQVINIKD